DCHALWARSDGKDVITRIAGPLTRHYEDFDVMSEDEVISLAISKIDYAYIEWFNIAEFLGILSLLIKENR
ncbi:hypothetical protein, partial [Candidatus Oleimmundimicrobium sp.]|uniref:hypothetical protein n=1 Tax=Candidatus Oleimmundimicrobium sp. TaxID=3060597 RepID=UPI002728D74C